MIKLVVFDADKTLWDHHNISLFEEPLKIINQNSIEDSKGNKLTLFPSVRETLQKLKEMGLYLALVTWNFPEKTQLVLKALKLDHFFDLVVSHDYPFKFLYISEIISRFHEKGINLKPVEFVFIDDRKINFGNTWLYIGNVVCLEMWGDINDHRQIVEKIKTIYNSNEFSEKNYSNA